MQAAARCGLVFLLLLIAAGSSAADGPRGYYRQPAISGETIVFVAEGDLWTVGIQGGVARRLTTHAGAESHPAISSDGRTVAFSAAYEGPTEVYTMPLAGGLPVRRTYLGEEVRVAGWTPDGKILCATRAWATLPSTQLLTLDPQDDRLTPVPLAQAAEGAYDPAGRVLVFTRLAPHWSHTKRYRGGTAQNLWRYAGGDAEATALTADYPGTSRAPMWWQGRIYFVSDRDSTMNLWSMTPAGEDLRQHTHHQGWDVQGAGLSAGRIVYRLGADLRFYDIAADRDLPIEISLASDLDQTRERWITEPAEHLSAVHLSPTGERVALTAYGQVFTAPVGPGGRLAQVTRRPGVRYRQARFLPDGDLIALSDESGEVEWWRLSATGTGAPQQITRNGRVLRTGGLPSPDGRWIASTDHDQKLWLHEIGGGRTVEVAFSPMWGFDGPTWSPDSRWLAYAMDAPNAMSRIFLYRIADGRTFPLTSDRNPSWCAQWSPDGRWIYLLSDRVLETRIENPWGPRQPEPFFDQRTRIYAVPLAAGLRSPFRPPDELEEESAGEAPETHDPPEVEIDLAGITERLEEVPVEAGDYRSLAVNAERLFWIAGAQDEERELRALPIGNDDPEPLTLASAVTGYELSADGRSLLVRSDQDLFVIDAGPIRTTTWSSGASTSRPGPFRSIPASCGGRCSSSPGGSSATISTIRACTGSTGRPCCASTCRWSPG